MTDLGLTDRTARVLAGRSLWDELTPLLRPYHKTITAAIAYVGTGGASLLPFGEGSSVIVDASIKAVRAGSTDPHALLEWAKAGVRVHSLPNLHAKMILAESPDDLHDPFVVVGSANASAASAHRLHESLVLIDGAECVDEARAALLKWKSQAGTALSVTRLRELAEQFGLDRPESDGDEDESDTGTGSDEGETVLWPLPTSLYIAPVGDLDDVSAESLHKRDELADEFGCTGTEGDSEFRIDMFWWDEPDGYEYEPNWRYAEGSHIVLVEASKGGRVRPGSVISEPGRLVHAYTDNLASPARRYYYLHTKSSTDGHTYGEIISVLAKFGEKPNFTARYMRKAVLEALLSIWPDITYNKS